MKHAVSLSFVGGSIQLRLTGFEGQNGWATLCFDYNELEARPNDLVGSERLCFDLPPSELQELRDFLNRHATSPKTAER